MSDEFQPNRPAATYALKPAWVHDLLILWRRNQHLALLLERATDYTAHEIQSVSVRRACLEAIAALFVERRGAGAQARTLSQNVWATYSRNLPAAVLAPAYLVHLVAQRPLAYAVAEQLGDRFTPGSTLDAGELLRRLAGTPDGGRPAELDGLLHTLYYFGVLGPRRGRRYDVEAKLPVASPVFPLLVWRWWERARAPCVELETFRRSPLFAFVETAGFASGWETHPGKLWTLAQAEGGLCACFHPHDRASFVRGLLNLLSTEGRRGRNLPRESEPPAEPPMEPPSMAAAPPARAG
jgi:hypothetical protein